jgi:Flp pilus assembly protein TadB
MNLERAWIIASALLLIVAAIFLWRNNLSVAFVIAALGACSWFLSYRAQMRSKIVDDELNEEPEDEVSTGSDSDRVETKDES